jgi:hypothetical protein
VFETLELGYPKPRWPPASDSLIDEARALLTEMQSDPVRIVSDSARHILVNDHERAATMISRTPNPELEPGTEREHEPGTQNPEV